MTLRKMMTSALVAAGLAMASSAAMAQSDQSSQPAPSQGEGPVLVAGTIDCRYQIRPAETAICSTPVLAAMDIQMVTLFNILNLLVNEEVGAVMAADQQEFLRERSACAADVNCIGESYAARIGALDRILKDIASRGPY
ncbi:hypothetical protein [Microbaculum marinum]|uniref:UrcA family protein n=1 Tax=Microbaculum marinum TaxID=1764581 RepID=A0AAW9RY02_9HYPH